MTPNMILKTWTESDLNLLMLEPLEVQASTIDARVIKIERFNRTVYSELGLLMLYFETKKLWHYVFDDKGERFTSFENWVVNRCPYSRSYALEAKAKMKILKESGTPTDALTEVPRCNVQILAQLPPALMRDPEVLKDAALLTEEAFRSKIAREHKEAHLEEKRALRFSPELSQRTVIDRAIELAMQLEETKSREIALESICAEYLLEHEIERQEQIQRSAHA